MGPLKMSEHLPQMNIFFPCHRSRKMLNTFGSEHLRSQVTTHEHLVEIVQYCLLKEKVIKVKKIKEEGCKHIQVQKLWQP